MTFLEIQIKHTYNAGFGVDVSFQTEAVVASLFGPSGSGKTTILSAIGGFLAPDEAFVRLGDRVLVDTKRGICVPPEKRRIGFVFQDHLLFPHMSVERNLDFGRRKQPAPKIDFHRVVDILELAPILQQMPRTLSGGEQQRVALGRAILSEPALLLMDEPLRSLDDALRSRVLAYLEKVLQQWKIPTIYVSHNQVEVRRLAEWTVAIDGGKVIDQGPTAQIIEHSTFLDRSGEMGPINVLRVTGVHLDAEGSWHGWIGTQLLALPPMPSLEQEGLISFPPNVVAILTGEGVMGSVRNRLAGVVKHLHHYRDRVLVGIDVGQLVWSEITPQACRELTLVPEMPVSCSIKARSIQPIE